MIINGGLPVSYGRWFPNFWMGNDGYGGIFRSDGSAHGDHTQNVSESGSKRVYCGNEDNAHGGSIVCVAKAVSSILTAGTIIDTIIYGLSFILKAVPTILQGPAMYMINIVINIFITSGSGQAAVVIPIVAPLADMIGITKTDCCTGISTLGMVSATIFFRHHQH